METLNAIRELLDIPVPLRNRGILPASLVQAYDILSDGIRGFRKKISLPDPWGTVKDSLDIIWLCADSDNPAVFWTKNSFQCTCTGNTVNLTVKYMRRSKAEEYAGRLLDAVEEVDRAASAARGDALTLALSVHDYLASKIVYDPKGPMCHSAAGALLEGRAVCSGISAAASLMLNRAGVRCETVFGKVRGRDDIWHSWNRVCDGKGLMHMDITNDMKSQVGFVSHKYFLLNREKAVRALSWVDDGEEPSDFDYFRRAGRYAGSAGEAERIMTECAERGIYSAEMAVDPGLAEKQLVDSIGAAYGPYCRGAPVTYRFDRKMDVFSYEVDGTAARKKPDGEQGTFICN